MLQTGAVKGLRTMSTYLRQVVVKGLRTMSTYLRQVVVMGLGRLVVTLGVVGPRPVVLTAVEPPPVLHALFARPSCMDTQA